MKTPKPMPNQSTRNLPTGWREVKLGDVATLNYGKSLPEGKRVNGDIPVYSSAGLTGWHDKALIENGGIIVGRKGTIGSVYKSKAPFFPIDTVFYISTKDTSCNLDFLFYMLSNLKLYNLNSDSAVPGLNRNAAYAQRTTLPPLPEQKAIAEILSSLDDKIDLLHRQNKTLENIAQTLFKQWFIEEADADWENCKVEDLCSFVTSGGTPLTKREDYYNGTINWYSTKELRDNFLFDSTSKITEAGLNNSSAKLFPKHTVVIAIYASPTVGRLGILTGDATFNQAACGLVADENLCCYEFLYLYLKSQRDELNAMASGSAQQNLNVSKIKNYPAVIPCQKQMTKFKISINPIFNKTESTQAQLITLENLRDTLLPKLMSGTIRVANH